MSDDAPDTIHTYAARRATLLVTCLQCARETLIDARALVRNARPGGRVEDLPMTCRTCYSGRFKFREYQA